MSISSLSLGAIGPERDFQAPGRSQAVAGQCMVATSHPLATLTALEILRDGGNAVDAAVAAGATLGVVEPTQTGIGGDCFALYLPAGRGSVHALNGSGWAPAAAQTPWYVERGLTRIAADSPHAVTVPGAVAAWERLVIDHGTLGLERLLAPAIRAARDGYVVTERVAHDWRRQEAKLARHASAAQMFLDHGSAPVAGTIHRQPQLAEALQSIAKDGARAFYEGWIAEDIVTYLRSLGGLHTLEDFVEFKSEYVEPIHAGYRGYEIWQCPPNGQGLIPLIMARVLQHFDLSALAPSSAERIHLLAESGRLAYAIRDAVLGDPRAGHVPVVELLSDRYTAALAQRISPQRRLKAIETPTLPEHRDTTFLAVVDRDLNTVAFINSIFDDFGSGLVTPRTGIVLHNRGSGFVVEPGHPNTIAGRNRPLHTIIPGLLTREGRAVMSFGVTGGHFQPLGQIQLLSNLIDHGMSLQQAIDHPRFFARGETFEVEHMLNAASVAELMRLGHPIAQAENPLGTAQAVAIDWHKGVLYGAADGRRDGLALGW